MSQSKRGKVWERLGFHVLMAAHPSVGALLTSGSAPTLSGPTRPIPTPARLYSGLPDLHEASNGLQCPFANSLHL